MINTNYSAWYLKKEILKNGFALDNQGNPTWFYSTAIDRGFADPLLNHALDFVKSRLSFDSRILVTGCGTGIIPFHLNECGFKRIEGRDLLPECITVAKTISRSHYESRLAFKVENGFKPDFSEGKFSLITAMHWVFSAWMGNYGNSVVENPYDQEKRNQLLSDFLGKYNYGLEDNGIFIIELTDAVADYRAISECPREIYPVRYSPSDVEECAGAQRFRVIEKNLSTKYGHQPRTSYFLQKIV